MMILLFIYRKKKLNSNKGKVILLSKRPSFDDSEDTITKL